MDVRQSGFAIVSMQTFDIWIAFLTRQTLYVRRDNNLYMLNLFSLDELRIWFEIEILEC